MCICENVNNTILTTDNTVVQPRSLDCNTLYNLFCKLLNNCSDSFAKTSFFGGERIRHIEKIKCTVSGENPIILFALK